MQGYSIDNITIQQYFELEDSSEYDLFIDTIKPLNSFNGHKCDLKKLTFDEVETIKNMFFSASFNDIKDVFIFLYNLGSFNQSALNEFLNTSVFDLFRAKNYIKEWLLELIKREKNALSGEADEKLLMVNANERLSAVSHILTKMRLAEQFGKSPEEVGKWKYTTVFTILVANKRSNDVQKDYANIK